MPFALFYSGLQATTAATGALINHFQFVLVALFAAVFLKERVRPAVWAGMLVLLIGSVLGTLSATQWQFLVLTGGLLLLFTVTTFTAIRLASVSAVLAIGSGAPIITTLLQFLAGGTVQLAPADLAGLALALAGVSAIMALAVRQNRLVASAVTRP